MLDAIPSTIPTVPVAALNYAGWAARQGVPHVVVWFLGGATHRHCFLRPFWRRVVNSAVQYMLDLEKTWNRHL